MKPEDARHSVFTDDYYEYAKAPDMLYLVEDTDLVVKAFLKDIEEGAAWYSEPADFLDKHGIEWR